MKLDEPMSSQAAPSAARPGFARLYRVIFRSDTRAGRVFDLTVIGIILASVIAVSVETVPTLGANARHVLRVLEWIVTVLFTIEYLLRILVLRRPLVYVTSFFGAVDLLAILPSYASLVVPGAQVLLVVRMLRLLRVFRILKLTRYVAEATTLGSALRSSARKIAVFLLTVLTIVVIVGALMYVIEGPTHGFTDIPVSIYWAIVTLTTVGYGDISPGTTLGQMLASVVMILGYGIIAVPTGIFTAELAASHRRTLALSAQGQGASGAGESRAAMHDECARCGTVEHAVDARYCRRCGARL